MSIEDLDERQLFGRLFNNLVYYLDEELKIPLPMETKTADVDAVILLCRIHLKPKMNNIDQEVANILPQLSGAQQSEIQRLTEGERNKIKRFLKAMCELV